MIFEQMAKRLYDQSSFERAVQVVLGDAIALHGAEFGNVQLAAGDYLVIAAQRGFKAPFIDFFARVRADDGCACGRALRTGRTVVMRPIALLPVQQDLTTPLFTNKKILIGTVSTHFVNVHTPTAIEIDALRSCERSSNWRNVDCAILLRFILEQ
jgi:hypothetical protein